MPDGLRAIDAILGTRHELRVDPSQRCELAELARRYDGAISVVCPCAMCRGERMIMVPPREWKVIDGR